MQRQTQFDIRHLTRDIASAVLDCAVAILTNSRNVLEDGARELLRKETLNEAGDQSISHSLVRPSY